MRSDARTNLQRAAVAIADNAACLSPTSLALVLDVSKSTAHAILERLAAVAAAAGKTPLETAQALAAGGLATVTAAAPAPTTAAPPTAPRTDDPTATAPTTTPDTESPSMSLPTAPASQTTIAPVLAQTGTAPAGSVPAGIAGLLAQAAADLGALEATATSATNALARERTARASAEAERDALVARLAGSTLAAVAAADVAPEDQIHVPAAIPNWTPLGIEPALRWCAQHGIPAALVGPPGCGKSDVCRQVAADLGRPYARIGCSDGATVGDLIGRRDVTEGRTHWTDGPMPRAARRGFHVTLDELGAAPAGVLASVHDLASSNTMHLPVTGETVRAAGGFWLTATSNWLGSDRVDTTHEQPISAALADRFAVFAVSYGAPKIEADLARRVLGLPGASAPSALQDLKPTKTVPTDEAAALLNDLRAAESAGDLSGPYSRRRLFDLLRFWMAWGGTAYGTRLACRAALIDRHPPSQQDAVWGLVQRHLGVAKEA